MKLSDLNSSIKDRFASQYTIVENGCWNWTGVAARGGYGRIRNGVNGSKRRVLAHRVSMVLKVGEVPDGMLVCHHCDNPKCVNPEHLYIGTALQNNTDRVVRNRSNSAQGVRVGSAKLTPNIVSEIVRVYGEKTESQYTVAKKFNVSQTTIFNIVSGRGWKSSGNIGAEVKSRGRKGELAGASKITQETADSIRSLKGTMSQVKIASMFGVSQQLVSLIFCGKVW